MILTQCFIKYAIINIFYDNFILDDWKFLLYLLALLCVIAAGYIINDIYDVEIDKINKIDQIVITKTITVENGYRLYYLLNIIGIIIGFYLAYLINKPILGFLFIYFIFSLWRYSKKFKTSFIIGNIQVAWLTGLSIINISLFDLLPSKETISMYYDLYYSFNNSLNLKAILSLILEMLESNGSLIIFKIIFFYTLFSFIITFLR